MVLIVQLAVAGALFLLAPMLARWFSEQNQVQEAIVMYLSILPLGYGAQGIIILTNSSFNALHQPRQALGLSVLRFFGLLIPLSWLMAQWLQLKGIFVAGVLANVLCASLAYLWFNKVMKKMERHDS